MFVYLRERVLEIERGGGEKDHPSAISSPQMVAVVRAGLG